MYILLSDLILSIFGREKTSKMPSIPAGDSLRC